MQVGSACLVSISTLTPPYPCLSNKRRWLSQIFARSSLLNIQGQLITLSTSCSQTRRRVPALIWYKCPLKKWQTTLPPFSRNNQTLLKTPFARVRTQKRGRCATHQRNQEGVLASMYFIPL